MRLLPRRRPRDRAALVASAGVAIGLVIIVVGFASATTGRDAQGLPDEIELLAPAPGDSVLRQSEVLVDLAPGYTGELIIDDIRLVTVEIEAASNPEPGDVAGDVVDVRFDPGSNTLRFQPREGAPIERFDAGTHDVTVVFWRIDEGRGGALSFSWQFDVSI